MSNAETLFFVNNQQSQIFELDVAAEYSVSADQKVDLAFFKVAQHLFLFCRRYKSAEHFYSYGKRFHSFKCSLEVLHGKYGCRHKDCTLFAVTNAFECRTQGNLCFAKANIAAKQSVHRCCFFHIAFDFVNRAKLVVGFFVCKAEFKIPLHIRVFGKCKALCVHSL